MKRANHLLEKIAEPDNLRLAYWKAGKGKRYTQEVMAYGRQFEREQVSLREQILSGEVVVGNYRFFKVFEPKERQICASAFREQVLHHAIMNICHDHFERVQIYDSYASRKRKGTYAALQRAERFARTHKWHLKLDVKKFFESIHHEVVKGQLARMFKDHRLLAIFAKIIDSYQASPGRGLPIGNLTSQYLANHYLADLDHYIREQIGIGTYVRYMDDMILWHNEKDTLKVAFQDINEFVQNRLRCFLKPRILNRSRMGLSFLGYRIFPYYTQLTQQSKQRFIRKMRILMDNYDSGLWSETECQRRVLSLLAFVSQADTEAFRRRIKQIYGQSS